MVLLRAKRTLGTLRTRSSLMVNEIDGYKERSLTRKDPVQASWMGSAAPSPSSDTKVASMNSEDSWPVPIQVSVVVSSHGAKCTYLEIMLRCLLVQAHHKIVPMLNGMEFVDRLTDRPIDDIHWEMLVINDGLEEAKRNWVAENQSQGADRLAGIPQSHRVYHQ